MVSIFRDTCGQCDSDWSSEYGAHDCPSCELMEKIDKHIESILLQIITSYYGKYIVEIDDKSAAWINGQEFSFRIIRKHNLLYLSRLNNISLKNTYLLMASNIESAFTDIQYAYKLKFGKYPPNVNDKETLYKSFVNTLTNIGANKFDLRKVRFVKIANYVRLIANIIKHNNSEIKLDSSFGKMIKIKKDTNIEELWRIELPDDKLKLVFEDIVQITHCVRIFFLTLSFKLLQLNVAKTRKITILNTLSLLRVKLRENISNEIIKSVHDDALLFVVPAFIKVGSNAKLFVYLRKRINFLNGLLKIKPQFVTIAETGIGALPEDNEFISKSVSELEKLAKGLYGNRSRANNNNFVKLRNKIIEKLIQKYGKKSICDLIWNDFDSIDKKILPMLIVAFYKEIYALGERNAGVLIRGFGGFPFRKWNPFSFHT